MVDHDIIYIIIIILMGKSCATCQNDSDPTFGGTDTELATAKRLRKASKNASIRIKVNNGSSGITNYMSNSTTPGQSQSMHDDTPQAEEYTPGHTEPNKKIGNDLHNYSILK